MSTQKKTLGSFIDDIIKESLERKRKLVEDAAVKQQKQEDGELKLDTLIDRLNSIRSGKSFRDKDVHASMQQYFDKLSKEERLALDAFLKGISQIMTGEIPGTEAPDPNDSPPNIKMSATSNVKQPEQQTKSVKPGVVSGKSGTGEAVEQEKEPIEDRTPPRQVIVPKKRA